MKNIVLKHCLHLLNPITVNMWIILTAIYIKTMIL
ncbi:Uncharacterised protein [Streptococcus pneumoniae]|nr:Uncharacterised protein [Streptococcus pneumoniae]